MLYNDCIANNNNESAWFRNFLLAVGDFTKLEFDAHGDIWLHYNSGVGVNNARTCALHSLAIAHNFNPDGGYDDYFSTLDGIIGQNCFYGTTMPDSAYMTSYRYLHYEVYALAKYILAKKAMGQDYKSYTYRLLDYITSYGQVMDEQLEASTERRGVGLNYAYMAQCLYFADDPYLSEACVNVMEKYMSNDNINGTITWPLDGYSTESDLTASNTNLIGREEITEMMVMLM